MFSIDILADSPVKLGVDVFIEKAYKEYRGKNLALITNATGVTSNLKSTIDVLLELKDPALIKLFGPEHGIRGDAYGGDKVDDTIDKKTGLPVYSMYGKHRKPTKEMLANVDVLIYDIQDIDNRTYTYINTMAYAMQAAAENNIEFLVFDRPIAMYGNLVDGNILDINFSSFIGLYPIPYVYGMTPGELAKLINKEFDINASLSVIKMEGYNHEMEFGDTGLIWVPTSPHIPRYETAYFCAATGAIGELHSVCVGIGYTLPFELIGEEWIDNNLFADDLNSRNLPGVFFKPTTFKPFYSVFKNKICYGVQLLITDSKKFQPFFTQIHILESIQKLFPENEFLQKGRTSSFDRAAGTDRIRLALMDGLSAEEIIASYVSDLNQFKLLRKKYLLYE
jgi:uncharacterized protein YbbC (DUF1343 family)